MTDLAQIITERVCQVTGGAPVALHEPSFKGNELAYVKQCIDTGWVSSVGSFVDRFEHDLAEVTGAKHAVVVCNGTSGLQMALQASGVERGDEVLIPALSFVATANAVMHCGAHPHFVDSDATTLGLSVAALADHLSGLVEQRNGALVNRHTGRRIAAVAPPGSMEGEGWWIADDFDAPIDYLFDCLKDDTAAEDLDSQGSG